MRISAASSDLISKLSTVSALQGRVSLASAGGPIDPGMQSVPMPASWVLFEGEDVVSNAIPMSTNRGYQQEDVLLKFSVWTMISYASQADLINNQWPTLEAIADSVSGRQAGSSATGLLRWKYVRNYLAHVSNDRLIYVQEFLISGTIQPQLT